MRKTLFFAVEKLSSLNIKNLQFSRHEIKDFKDLRDLYGFSIVSYQLANKLINSPKINDK